MSKPDFKAIANNIIGRLQQRGVSCYLWHGNHKSASHYIRFEEQRMGSIRISDHPGKPQYKYRFNVRTDVKEQILVEKNITRWFFKPTNRGIKRLIQVILIRHYALKNVKTEPKYKYNIPYTKLYPSSLSPKEQMTLQFDEDRIASLQNYIP